MSKFRLSTWRRYSWRYLLTAERSVRTPLAGPGVPGRSIMALHVPGTARSSAVSATPPEQSASGAALVHEPRLEPEVGGDRVVEEDGQVLRVQPHALAGGVGEHGGQRLGTTRVGAGELEGVGVEQHPRVAPAEPSRVGTGHERHHPHRLEGRRDDAAPLGQRVGGALQRLLQRQRADVELASAVHERPQPLGLVGADVVEQGLRLRGRGPGVEQAHDEVGGVGALSAQHDGDVGLLHRGRAGERRQRQAQGEQRQGDRRRSPGPRPPAAAAHWCLHVARTPWARNVAAPTSRNPSSR